jgi:hypothetical protein
MRPRINGRRVAPNDDENEKECCGDIGGFDFNPGVYTFTTQYLTTDDRLRRPDDVFIFQCTAVLFRNPWTLR